MSLLQKALNEMDTESNSIKEDRFLKLQIIKEALESSSPYDICSEYDLLVNNSAEDFMMEFMTAYNNEVGSSY